MLSWRNVRIERGRVRARLFKLKRRGCAKEVLSIARFRSSISVFSYRSFWEKNSEKVFKKKKILWTLGKFGAWKF